MRVSALMALLFMLPACRFDLSALHDVKLDSGVSDTAPDAGLPDLSQNSDRIPADQGREAGQSDAGSDALQDDASQSDTLVQSDTLIQTDTLTQSDAQQDAGTQSDAEVQTDSGVQTDGPPHDPCVDLVADYSSNYGIIDHCNDGEGHPLTVSGGHVYAIAGICRIICWTQPSENASILPDSCSGTWDVLVGGPSSWTSAGCVSILAGVTPYVHGCNSDRSCEVPKYPP